MSSEQDHDAHIEMLRQRTALTQAYFAKNPPEDEKVIVSIPAALLSLSGFTLPPSVISSSASTTLASKSPPERSDTHPGSPLCLKDIENAERTKLDAAAILEYQRDPESLLGKHFVSDSDGLEIYRLASIASTETEDSKLFFLVFADEGPEAVRHSSEFFSLLATSSLLNV
ncbi:hypothetical protein B0H14DRAFT_3509540 [Mycena olivaceomarginata]|nr:hypothetical protein B0H14DRAFT_3509540 [Mycena olivaceomarginata]